MPCEHTTPDRFSFRISIRVMSFFIILSTLLLSVSARAAPAEAPHDIATSEKPRTTVDTFHVLECAIDAAITPAQVDLLEKVFLLAKERHADMILLRLDTPGGLASSMRDMVKQILNASVPVAVWVGPAGAQAASAGVFLVAAADIAAMSPQTTLGSASPVTSSGEDISETMAKKIQNDFTSLLRGMAKHRGRNVEWYVSSVTKSENVTASEAVMERIVDLLAISETDLMNQLGRRGVPINNTMVTFDENAWTIEHVDPGFRYRVLSWLLDPQIAYFLLLGGMAGLFFELATPGAVLPGVIGGLCLVLGLYSMSILPTSAAGLLLIVFAVVLFILELFITSFGLLSLAGLIGLFLGSLLLFRTGEGMSTIPLSTIIVTVSGMAIILLSIATLAARAFRRKPQLGTEGLIGARAEIRKIDGDSGKVFVAGELWKAHFLKTSDLTNGSYVRVVRVNGLVLDVEPATDTNSITLQHAEHP